MTTPTIDQKCIDTIRTLSMEAVQAANSGHPGTPMALAPVAYTLWQNHLNYDPAQPDWPARDRFVLSAGHASMLLYSTLHLAGVRSTTGESRDVTLEDIKNFRQFESACPGHPESGWTTGVETTTGPLGQGLATSVGMAIGAKWQAEQFNRPDHELFGNRVYALCGDGCLMEGISQEAASLAGHLELDNLCWIYDSNGITIEGSTELAFSEDVEGRFESAGWNVIRVSDANDTQALDQAFTQFQETTACPTLIIVKSHIGFGSPNLQDTHTAHGAPLGHDEIKLTKRAYGWPEDSQFLVPEDVIAHFKNGIGARGSASSSSWQQQYDAWKSEFPELAATFESMVSGETPELTGMPCYPADTRGVAGRAASGEILNTVAQQVPWLIGGAADLAPSTKTTLKFEDAGEFSSENRGGRNFHFGIREHAMGAVLNGLAHTGVRAFGSGFFVFTDYLRPSLRLSALMELPVIHIYTHDSIAVGEDGPTHQPIEHLASLRSMPHVLTFRPGDANETVACWRVIMEQNDRPCAIVLSRQNLPTLDRSLFASESGASSGAYVLADCDSTPEVILIGTGSEIHLCVQAYEQLTAEGVSARVVSMPSWELFEEQSEEYRQRVLPPQVRARVAVEQAATFGWERWVGTQGTVIGIDSFGASAPQKDLVEHFGFTADRVVEAAKEQIRTTVGA